MSLSRRVGWNTAAQIGGRLYTSSLAFVITALVLPRQLSEAAFGIFAFHLTLHQLLTNVLDFGAGTIVIRDASRRREQAGALVGTLILIKGVIALLGCVALVVVALAFEGPSVRFVVLVMAALSLLAHAPAGAGTIFHVDMEFRWTVRASALGQTAWLTVTFTLVALDVTEPAAYLVAFAAGVVTNAALCWTWARARMAIRFDAGRAALLRLWREAWPAGVSMTMASVYFYVDTIMLRPLRGEVETAHYSAGYRLMTFVLMVPVLFSQVIFPVFSRLWERGPAVLQPVFRRSLTVLLALGLTVPATLPFVAEDVVGLVYPRAFLPGARCLAVLALAVALVFAAYPHVLLLLAAGHQRVLMGVSAGAALLNVAANAWAIPRFGILGAAWTTVATEAAVLLGAALAGARLTGLHAAGRDLLRPLVAAGAACALTVWSTGALAAGAAWQRVATAMVLAGLAALAAGALPLALDAGEDPGEQPGDATDDGPGDDGPTGAGGGTGDAGGDGVGTTRVAPGGGATP